MSETVRICIPFGENFWIRIKYNVFGSRILITNCSFSIRTSWAHLTDSALTKYPLPPLASCWHADTTKKFIKEHLLWGKSNFVYLVYQPWTNITRTRWQFLKTIFKNGCEKMALMLFSTLTRIIAWMAFSLEEKDPILKPVASGRRPPCCLQCPQNSLQPNEISEQINCGY